MVSSFQLHCQIHLKLVHQLIREENESGGTYWTQRSYIDTQTDNVDCHTEFLGSQTKYLENQTYCLRSQTNFLYTHTQSRQPDCLCCNSSSLCKYMTPFLCLSLLQFQLSSQTYNTISMFILAAIPAFITDICVCLYNKGSCCQYGVKTIW